MKAISLVATRGPNPAFDASEFRAAVSHGRKYDTPAEIDYPAGTEFDNSEVWIHCVRSPPTMAPADDECRRKVQRWLQHKSRKAMLSRFKHLSTPAVYAKCPKWLQQYIDSVKEKWGEEIASVAPDTTSTPNDIRDAIEDMGGEVPDDDADGLHLI